VRPIAFCPDLVDGLINHSLQLAGRDVGERFAGVADGLMEDAPSNGFFDEFGYIALFHALCAQKRPQSMIDLFGPGNSQTGSFGFGHGILLDISIYPPIRITNTTIQTGNLVCMATLGLIEYDAASPEVRAVYDDIMATRKTDWINNFWKAIANHLPTLRRTWASIKEIMGPGSIDALTKEMIYVAVSTTNQCGYCIASHTAAARKAGMTDAMFAELIAVVGMANETNRLASGYQVEIDGKFLTR
jgi:AhpD family alkylhydroperoxidase